MSKSTSWRHKGGFLQLSRIDKSRRQNLFEKVCRLFLLFAIFFLKFSPWPSFHCFCFSNIVNLVVLKCYRKKTCQASFGAERSSMHFFSTTFFFFRLSILFFFLIFLLFLQPSSLFFFLLFLFFLQLSFFFLLFISCVLVLCI